MQPSWRDRLILGALGALPTPLAKHMLFLMQTRPALADALGYHVRPIHYYEPMPDFRTIERDAPSRRRISPAIDFDIDGQRHRVAELRDRSAAELAGGAITAFDFGNGYFAGFDAAIYYALIRKLRPKRVIEIGAGMSTQVATYAMARNAADGDAGEVVCIEPDPQPRLTAALPAATLIQKRVEELPLETFDALQANDVLFIDSSHALKFGGDVHREFLDILPRLAPGVWIHVHDIFFPHDYPAAWLIDDRRAFTEQYLLEAFLAFNSSFRVELCNHWLWAEHRDELIAGWPTPVVAGSEHHPPASFWMTRRA